MKQQNYTNPDIPSINKEEGRVFVKEMNWMSNVQPVIEKYAFIKETVIGTAIIGAVTFLAYQGIKRIPKRKKKEEGEEKK